MQAKNNWFLLPPVTAVWEAVESEDVFESNEVEEFWVMVLSEVVLSEVVWAVLVGFTEDESGFTEEEAEFTVDEASTVMAVSVVGGWTVGFSTTPRTCPWVQVTLMVPFQRTLASSDKSAKNAPNPESSGTSITELHLTAATNLRLAFVKYNKKTKFCIAQSFNAKIIGRI